MEIIALWREAVRRASLDAGSTHLKYYVDSNMIKQLLLTAALLLPDLAYGANPSATLSVQVVPAGHGSTCGIPFGAAAAAVAAAGFNTCALFSDFTASTGADWVPSFSGSVATTSNWLACNNGTGNTSATWYLANGNRTPTYAPCSAVFQTTDTGVSPNVKALDLQYLSSFTNGNNSFADQPTLATAASIACPTCNPPTGCPTCAINSYPLTSYYEATYRIALNPSNYFSTSTLWDWGFWGFNPTNNNNIEIDNPEEQSNGSCQLHVIDYVFNTIAAQNCTYDPFNYHTYGLLVTGTESAMSMCIYFDGTLQNCINYTPPNSQATQKRYVILWSEPKCGQQDGNGTCAGSFNEVDMYIKSVKVFTCAGWATTGTGVCNGNIVQ